MLARGLLRASLGPARLSLRSLSSSSSARPFRVLGLQQVAVGGLDKAALSSFWVDLLGVERVGTYRAEKENVDEDILKVGRGLLGTVEIDIMQPLNPEVAPKVHIPALNHIGLWVDNLKACHENLSAKGVKFAGGIRKGAAGHDVAFIHPKSAVGVLVELVQAPDSVIKAYDEQR